MSAIKSFYNIEEYGAVEGEDITEILQTAIDFQHDMTVYIPAKRYYISDTIVFPNMYGGSLYGAGFCANVDDLESVENHSNATLVWSGPKDKPMLHFTGSNFCVDGALTIIGKDTGVLDANRASIGILILEATGIGGGKNVFNALTLADCDTLLQCGTYSSGGGNDNLIYNYFNTAGSCNVVYKTINLQSMKHQFFSINHQANCNQFFQVFEGGMIFVNHAKISSGCIFFEAPIGSQISSNSGIFRFDNVVVEESVGSNFKAVAVLENSDPLKVTFNNLDIKYNNYFNDNVICFDIIASSDIALRDCKNIQKSMFKLRKQSNHGKPNIYLERCKLSGINTSADFFYTGSTGYYFSTKDCNLDYAPTTDYNLNFG